MVPGSLDIIVLRMARDVIPDFYKNRKIYMHNPHVTGVRTSQDELRRLAEIVSDKFNRATGPAAVVFPLRGFSAIDREGFAFHEPETDRTFLEGLKKELKEGIEIVELKEGIEIVEVDAHLFDDDFIREVARVYDETARRGEHHG
jgi:uncharacterized protein (UPF0261 family)